MDALTKFYEEEYKKQKIAIPLTKGRLLSIIQLELDDDCYELAVRSNSGKLIKIDEDTVYRFDKKHLHQVIARVYEWLPDVAVLHLITEQ